MSKEATFAEFCEQRVGSLASVARASGIPESTLRAFSDGSLAPDDAHVRRLRIVVGRDLPTSLFPHRAPKVDFLDVSEARVRAKRTEHLVRPGDVKADDLVRLASERDSGPDRFVGWVKVARDAEWVRADLVRFPLKDGTIVECHPAQTVTVARKPIELPDSDS